MTTAPDIGLLYENYHTAILNFFRRRILTPGSSPELAEDYCQECFRKAFEAIRDGTEVTHVSGWIFQIARNMVVDFHRYKKHHVPTVPWDEVWHESTHEPSPHELAEQAIVTQRVRRAISGLRDEQRIVITRRMEGYDFNEIAAEIDKPYGATKALQHRGYVYLQMWLKEAQL